MPATHEPRRHSGYWPSRRRPAGSEHEQQSLPRSVRPATSASAAGHRTVRERTSTPGDAGRDPPRSVPRQVLEHRTRAPPRDCPAPGPCARTVRPVDRRRRRPIWPARRSMPGGGVGSRPPHRGPAGARDRIDGSSRGTSTGVRSRSSAHGERWTSRPVTRGVRRPAACGTRSSAQTSIAAAASKPPANTDSRAQSTCSASSSRP